MGRDDAGRRLRALAEARADDLRLDLRRSRAAGRRVVGGACAGSGLARKGIAEALGRVCDARSPQTIYPTFTTAVVAAFVVLAMPVLFGFIATVLTVSVVPLATGTAVSYGGWALLWPRRVLWERWTWQAKLRRGDGAGDTGLAR